MTMRNILFCLLLGAAVLVVACQSSEPKAADSEVVMAPEMADDRDPYAEALLISLPKVAPEDREGIYNVFQLSENIVSGSEPADEEAFSILAAKGVKTILSVDGAAPKVELAARYGMRYVHIPIQYKTITEDETLRIVKSFREMEAPFYVHCFHGRHRGPAGAAIGRIVLDGASREQAVAEMRQYSGTAEKYRGLYARVAQGYIPSAAESMSYDFGFDPVVKLQGVRETMIVMPRAFDKLKDLMKRDFVVDPDHPDVDPRNESAKLMETFAQAMRLEETAGMPEDFRNWMAKSQRDAIKLAKLLGRPISDDEVSLSEAKATVKAIGKSCSACHRAYRNY